MVNQLSESLLASKSFWVSFCLQVVVMSAFPSAGVSSAGYCAMLLVVNKLSEFLSSSVNRAGMLLASCGRPVE